MSNLKKNISLQTLYQIIITITPLITSPYLSRVLGADGLGIYSFTYSLISYFVLFSMLGFVNYGTRTIAMCKNMEEEKRSFFEIYYLQLFCSLFSLIVFFIFNLFIFAFKKYMLIHSLLILSCCFDVSWYFFGKQEFKTTVVRNIIIKALTIIMILTLVKDVSDLWIYILIMSLSNFMSSFILWSILLKNLKFQRINIKNSLKHFKAVFILFIPILAMSIYHIMDKTMLGMYSDSAQSGYYYNIDKLISIPLGILVGIGSVMLPRISSMMSNNIDLAKKSIKKSLKWITCISIAMAFGLSAIASDFIPIFFGNEFVKCINLVYLFSAVIIFKTISDIFRTQYLIPFKKENIFIKCVLIGALINLFINYMLINYFHLGAIGAIIATLITEFLVFILQYIFINKEFPVTKSILSIFPFLIFGFIMFLVVKLISLIRFNIFIKLFIEIFVGIVVYLCLCGIFYFKEIETFIRRKG